MCKRLGLFKLTCVPRPSPALLSSSLLWRTVIWGESYFAERVAEGFGGFSLQLLFYEGPHFVTAAHRHLLSIYSWTVDKASQWERCVRDGHDGIITDDPAGLAAYIASIRAKMFADDSVSGGGGGSIDRPANDNKDSRRTAPLIIGHRGYAAAFPENTMAAFRGAIDAGADGSRGARGAGEGKAEAGRGREEGGRDLCGQVASSELEQYLAIVLIFTLPNGFFSTILAVQLRDGLGLQAPGCSPSFHPPPPPLLSPLVPSRLAVRDWFVQCHVSCSNSG